MSGITSWYTEIIYILRVLLAASCGSLIGYERKNRMKEAGVRTHMIVCMGSALMMVVSKYGFLDVQTIAGMKVDPSRIASSIVTGIGFLGAGMIFVRKQSINGLTTSAGIWATAGIGMAIGCGMYPLGFFSTIIIVVLQVVLHKNQEFFHLPFSENILITMKNKPDCVRDLRQRLNQQHVEVVNIKIERVSDTVITVEIFAKFPHSYQADDLMDIFNDTDYIISAEL